MPFIPGFQALAPALQGVISGGLGKASGLSTKDALLGGLTVGMGAKFRNARQAAAGAGGITDAASKAKRPLFGKEGRFRDFFVKGSDDKNFLDNVFGGLRGGGQQTQMPEMQLDADGNPTGLYVDPVTGQTFTQQDLQEAGVMDNSGNIIGSALSNLNMGVTQETGPFGGQFGPFLRDKFLGTSEDPGFLRNLVGGGGDGGGLGGNAGLMAMAALYGKAVKSDYEKKEGGLKDIRQSVRPDLMPQQTYQGFDLGIRKAAMGGLQELRPGYANGTPRGLMANELDLRPGGPSIGPGTGTSDDIPAMLSDGEFVQTAKANNGLGGFKVTKTETGIELIPNGKPNRQKGAKNMNTLMNIFENYNDIGQV